MKIRTISTAVVFLATVAMMPGAELYSSALEVGPAGQSPDTTPASDPHGDPDSCDVCHDIQVDDEWRLDESGAPCDRCHQTVTGAQQDHLEEVLPEVRIKGQMMSYFSRRTDFTCLTCHEPVCQSGSREGLRTRNPHSQLDVRGEPIESACLFCHAEGPASRDPAEVQVVMRFETPMLCSLCHVMQSVKTGMGFGEVVPPEMMERKRRFERRHGVTLPLGPGNTVTCTSCHNPHQQGVVLGDSPFARPTGRSRLLVDDVWSLCQACHLSREE